MLYKYKHLRRLIFARCLLNTQWQAQTSILSIMYRPLTIAVQ